jgi:hypothetical protein
MAPAGRPAIRSGVVARISIIVSMLCACWPVEPLERTTVASRPTLDTVAASGAPDSPARNVARGRAGVIVLTEQI